MVDSSVTPGPLHLETWGIRVNRGTQFAERASQIVPGSCTRDASLEINRLVIPVPDLATRIDLGVANHAPPHKATRFQRWLR